MGTVLSWPGSWQYLPASLLGQYLCSFLPLPHPLTLAAVSPDVTDVTCVQINSGQERSSRQKRTTLPVLVCLFVVVAGFSWLI